MNYKLYAVHVYMTDWERSLEFDSKTLGVPIVFAGPDTGWAELDAGEAHRALERVDPGDAEALREQPDAHRGRLHQTLRRARRVDLAARRSVIRERP